MSAKSNRIENNLTNEEDDSASISSRSVSSNQNAEIIAAAFAQSGDEISYNDIYSKSSPSESIELNNPILNDANTMNEDNKSETSLKTNPSSIKSSHSSSTLNQNLNDRPTRRTRQRLNNTIEENETAKSIKEEDLDTSIAKRKSKRSMNASEIESNENLEDQDMNKAIPVSVQKIGAPMPVTNQNSKYLLKRQCVICKAKVHQDSLNDHCSQHFSESPKCNSCDKISTNPSNFVTHILSHLPTQFFCINCEKWFRQPIVYKRHKAECRGFSNDESIEDKSVSLEKRKLRSASNDVGNEPEMKMVKMEQIETESSIHNTRRGRPPKLNQFVLEKESVVESKIKQENERKGAAKSSKDNLSYVELKKRQIELNSLTNLRKKEAKNYNENDLFNELAILDKISQKEKKQNPKSDQSLKLKSPKESKKAMKIEEPRVNQYEKPYRNKSKRIEASNEPDQNSKYNYRTKLTNLKEKTPLRKAAELEESKNSSKNEETSANECDAKTTAESYKLKTTNDLTSLGTYKIKIQKAKSSHSSNKLSKENDLLSLNEHPVSFFRSMSQCMTSSKANNPMTSILAHSTSTPSFLGPNLSALLLKDKENSANNNVTHTYECPECDKKFVSYYGLVQHYDQHPKLKVTCVLCEITFDSHHLLVEHNTNVHQLDENGQDKDKER